MLQTIKQIIFVLLFSGNTLITPEPICIDSDWLTIIPEHSLKSISNGARLEIDITSISNGIRSFNGLDDRFPKGTVSAIAIDENGKKIYLHDGEFAIGKDDVRLLLHDDVPLPTDVLFNKILIKSKTRLPGVNVYWKNFGL